MTYCTLQKHLLSAEHGRVVQTVQAPSSLHSNIK